MHAIVHNHRVVLCPGLSLILLVSILPILRSLDREIIILCIDEWFLKKLYLHVGSLQRVKNLYLVTTELYIQRNKGRWSLLSSMYLFSSKIIAKCTVISNILYFWNNLIRYRTSASFAYKWAIYCHLPDWREQ